MMYIMKRIFNEDPTDCSWQSRHEAKEAQDWCEMADVGDVYDGKEFEIECVD